MLGTLTHWLGRPAARRSATTRRPTRNRLRFEMLEDRTVPDGFSGAIYTSMSDGTRVNQNLYAAKPLVYLNGGPQNANGSGLPDGLYYFQVTNPSGSVLLSSDPAGNRLLQVVGGAVYGTPGTTVGPGPAFTVSPSVVPYHPNGSYNASNLSVPVQLIPFDDTPNNGNEYKVWITPKASFEAIDKQGNPVGFKGPVKTDNFKVEGVSPPPPRPTVVNPTITGTKFTDVEGDDVAAGTIDADDTPLAGWTVYLYDADNNLVDTTVTDVDGLYSFDVTVPGATTAAVAEATYTIVEEVPTGWTQTYGGPGVGGTYTVTVKSGIAGIPVPIPEVDSFGNDFANFQDVTFSGIKYQDTNANGQQDANEPFLEGWTILVNGQDVGVETDANGAWTYTAGPGETEYTFTEALTGQPWDSFTPFEGADGYTVPVVSGGNTPDLAFGNFQNVTFSGMKFEDEAGDSVKDADDPGLEDWIILVNGEDVGIRTDADGNWSYTAGPGVYTFTEALTGQPWDDFTQTYGNAGYEREATTSGDEFGGLDFGNFENVILSGIKWEDVNGNGERDEGDGPLPGWTINVGDETAVTDGDGYWSLVVGPGTYDITEAATGQPWHSFTQTYPADNGGYSVTPTSGDDAGGNDFGNFRNVVFGGLKYEDHDGDGGRDDGDQPLEGWIILVNGEDVGLVTDANGRWSYTAGPGVYTFTEALTGQPWDSFTPLEGKDGYTPDVTSGAVYADLDFGNFENVTLSGVKWHDRDGDGVRDPEDEGLADWVINVGDETATTDADGNWSLEVGPGTFAITEAATGQPWAYFVQTYPADNAGYSVTTASGEDKSGYDFGNFQVDRQNGKTIGFWHNRNGRALIDGDDITALRALFLRNADGSDFDPSTTLATGRTQISNWLTSANASNMANMLSAQLTATTLNVREGFVSGSVYVGPGSAFLASGFNSLGANAVPTLSGLGLVTGPGIVSINALMAKADELLAAHPVVLAGHPERTNMTAIKDLLDAINNNLPIFVV